MRHWILLLKLGSWTLARLLTFPPLMVGWTVDMVLLLLLLLLVLVPEMRRGVVELVTFVVVALGVCMCVCARVGMCVNLSLD